MALVNRKIAPYYDDYDSSKQYTQLLAVPGRVAQAREITQVQSVVKDIVKSIGDSILKDGNIIEGCQVSISREVVSGVEITTAKISPGKVYLNGMVLPVRGALNTSTGEYGPVELPILGVGTETIGVRLNEYLITEREDSTLRDPAQGYDNYNQAGCHRIKSEAVVVLNDSSAATLVQLIDGAVSVEKYAPDYDVLTQTLARRTYDESGSYIVEGMAVRVEDHPNDPTKFNIVVESGKAYVLGYELKIPAPRRITLPRSLDTTSIVARWPRYSGEYTLISSTPYIQAITSVAGGVNKVVTQTIQSNVDEVLFPDTGVYEVVSVSQGSTNYTVGTSTTGDCYLRVDNDNRCYLSWRGTENHPTLGSDYTVSYNYDYTFVQGTDYELYHDTTNDSQSIHWKSTTRPLQNAQLTVAYNLYLARKDTLYIDQYGNINAILGIPATYGFETLPDAPVNTLSLAYVESPPSGSSSTNANLGIRVSNVGLTRFTMYDIQRLLDRIRTIEYDQTILSLNDEAKSFETTNDKKGIFTDPIIDISKVDFYYNLSEGLAVDSSLPTYDVTMDLDSNICYLPSNKEIVDAEYDETRSTATRYDRLATLHKTGTSILLSQMNATKSFLINPYSMFPQMPEISIDPAVDAWIDDTIITVPVSQQSSQIVDVDTRRIERNNTSGSRRADTVNSSSVDTVIGTRVDTLTNESVISEKAITYIRQRTINVEGSHYPSDIDNIKCYFDGANVALTPTGTTSAGTETGSVKANSVGAFTASFTIPANVLTGIREVRLASSVQVASAETSAFALYQASGTARTIQRTVTTLTTVLLNRVTTINITHNIDPVGQTFVLDRMTILNGVDIYFEAKAAGTTPVTCEIREVSNGTITSTVYGHKTLRPNQVNISSDSQIATTFVFETPVLLEANKEYAVVIRSTSPSYRIWVADLGENDIVTGSPVLTNPYLIGVMLSSSNNSSWTTHQSTDIKFRLLSDTYDRTSEIVFEDMEPAEAFSKIYLSADAVIPTGTSVDWYYSLNESSTTMSAYKKITPYNAQILDQMKTKVSIKAVLSREITSNLSPIIALDTVGTSLSSYDYSSEGRWYITKEVSGLSSYTSIDVILDAYYPSASTSLEVWVLNGTSLKKATLQTGDASDLMNYNWRRQTYSTTVTASTKCRIFVKLISSNGVETPAFRRLRVIMS